MRDCKNLNDLNIYPGTYSRRTRDFRAKSHEPRIEKGDISTWAIRQHVAEKKRKVVAGAQRSVLQYTRNQAPKYCNKNISGICPCYIDFKILLKYTLLNERKQRRDITF